MIKTKTMLASGLRMIAALAILKALGLGAVAQSTPPAPQNPVSQEQQVDKLGPPGASSPSQPPGGPSGSANSLRLAPGSVVPVRLTKAIDAKKAKKGETVEARVTQDLKAASGVVLIAKDTKFMGHVTEVQAHSKDRKESQLGIAFDHAVTKSGDEVPLPTSIQAVIAPPNSDRSNNLPNPDVGPGGVPPGDMQPTPGRMAGGPPAQIPESSTNDASRATSRQPAINGNTQGVVGISNLNLSTGTDRSQGSILSSDKSNVRLESGTIMLLRVDPNAP